MTVCRVVKHVSFSGKHTRQHSDNFPPPQFTPPILLTHPSPSLRFFTPNSSSSIPRRLDALNTIYNFEILNIDS